MITTVKSGDISVKRYKKMLVATGNEEDEELSKIVNPVMRMDSNLSETESNRNPITDFKILMVKLIDVNCVVFLNFFVTFVVFPGLCLTLDFLYLPFT